MSEAHMIHCNRLKYKYSQILWKAINLFKNLLAKSQFIAYNGDIRITPQQNHEH